MAISKEDEGIATGIICISRYLSPLVHGHMGFKVMVGNLEIHHYDRSKEYNFEIL